MYSCRAMISFGSWRQRGIAHVTGVLLWMDTGSLRRRRGVLYVREQQECMEFCLRMNDKPAESLWARTGGQNNMGDATVAVYYKLPDQEEVEETFR